MFLEYAGILKALLSMHLLNIEKIEISTPFFNQKVVFCLKRNRLWLFSFWHEVYGLTCRQNTYLRIYLLAIFCSSVVLEKGNNATKGTKGLLPDQLWLHYNSYPINWGKTHMGCNVHALRAFSWHNVAHFNIPMHCFYCQIWREINHSFYMVRRKVAIGKKMWV